MVLQLFFCYYLMQDKKVFIIKERKMGWKPLGTWGAKASFQLGGIIGCLFGLALAASHIVVGISLLYFALPIAVLAGVTIFAADAIAKVSGGITGAVVDTPTHEESSTSNTSNFMNTTIGNVITGVAAVGLVTAAIVSGGNTSASNIESSQPDNIVASEQAHLDSIDSLNENTNDIFIEEEGENPCHSR